MPQSVPEPCYPRCSRRCAMESIKLWARNGEAVRQAIELGEIAHIETASEELTDEFLLWLLLDSRVMDVLRLSNLMLVTLSSLQPFSDNVGAEDPRIP